MLNDFIFVLKYIKRLLEAYTLPDLYVAYANTLQQISQSSTPALQQQLKDTRDKIKQAHEELEPKGWSYSQLKFFDLFGARKIIGKQGYKRFETALTENAANIPGAIEAINSQGTEM